MGSTMITFGKRRTAATEATVQGHQAGARVAPQARRIGNWGVLLGVLLLVAFGAATEAAAQSTQSSSVVFLDDRDLTVEGGKAYRVVVRKVSNETQDISLRFLGFGPSGGESDATLPTIAIQAAPPGSDVDETRERAYIVQLNAPVPQVKASLEGLLVANAGAGIATKKILVKAQPVVAATPAPGAIADGLDTVTLSGVNYLPSPISYPLSALVAILLVPLVVLLYLCVQFVPNRPTARVLGGTAGTTDVPSKRHALSSVWVLPVLLMVALLAAWGTLAPGRDLVQPGLAAVSVPSVPLIVQLPVDAHRVPAQPAPAAAPGVVGVVAAGDGGFGAVTSDRSWLTVSGLPRAGKYDGKLDLHPEDDKRGALKISVVVADWWPWALLALVVGVLVGYLATRYFTVQRQVDELRVRVTWLWHQVTVAEPVLRPGYTMRQIQRQRLDQAIDRLALGDTDSAKTILNAVESYTTAFGRLLGVLAALKQARDQLAERLRARDFGLSAAERHATAVVAANRLLEGRLDAGREDIQGAQLTARIADVDKGVRLLDAATSVHDRLSGYIERADKLPNGTGRSERAELEKLGFQAMVAPDESTFANLVNLANVQLLSIREKEQRVGDPTEGVAAQPEATADDVWEPPHADRNVLARPDVGEDPGAAFARWATARQAFQGHELQMTLVTGSLAVASGLLLVYFATPTWGSPADYLKAFLWGSVLSEGTKYVTKLVTRVWPVG